MGSSAGTQRYSVHSETRLPLAQPACVLWALEHGVRADEALGGAQWHSVWKSRSAPLRVFYNPLIDWDLFLFFWSVQKKGVRCDIFLANYAVWNCFGRKVDGFRESWI